MAAILGLDPYRTIGDVYWSKVDPLGRDESDIPSDDDPLSGKSHIIAGNILESAVCQWVEMQLSVTTKRDIQVISKGADGGIFSANLDRQIIERNEIIEAKAIGAVRPMSNAELDMWGEEFTDQIPPYYIVQCQHQLYCTGFNTCWLGVYIGARGFRLYKVERNEAFINKMVAFGMAFWNNHVLPQVAPTNQPPPIHVLQAIERVPDKEVALGVELEDDVHNWLEAKEKLAEQKKIKEECEARIVQSLGDAEVGRLSDGSVFVYKKESAGMRLDANELRMAFPKIAKLFDRQADRYVGRLKQPKKKKESN